MQLIFWRVGYASLSAPYKTNVLLFWGEWVMICVISFEPHFLDQLYNMLQYDIIPWSPQYETVIGPSEHSSDPSKNLDYCAPHICDLHQNPKSWYPPPTPTLTWYLSRYSFEVFDKTISPWLWADWYVKVSFVPVKDCYLPLPIVLFKRCCHFIEIILIYKRIYWWDAFWISRVWLIVYGPKWPVSVHDASHGTRPEDAQNYVDLFWSVYILLHQNSFHNEFECSLVICWLIRDCVGLTLQVFNLMVIHSLGEPSLQAVKNYIILFSLSACCNHALRCLYVNFTFESRRPRYFLNNMACSETCIHLSHLINLKNK